MKINPGAAALERTKNKLDSIYKLVVDKKMDFYHAATNYSDAEESKFNGGMILNQEGSSRTTVIPMDGLEKSVFTAIDPLKPGEYSKPEQFTDKMGDVGYRFNYLKTRIPPHKANLDEDFTKIKEAARQDKINRNLSKWFDDKSKTTFINISDEFGSCDELKKWKKQ
jgi:peptidyl-prolyl cis-trans isomerase SurA